MKDRKKIYPAVLLGLTMVGVLGLWLLLKQYQIDVSIGPNQPTNSAPLPAITAPLPSQSPISQPETIVTGQPGSLRVSNQTSHPVLLVLLSRLGETPKSANSGQQGSFDRPSQWEFAPGEGGSRGLLLSLPGRKVQLKLGDILVAFAQDGSRNYWGPYVVGETPAALTWNSQTQEWWLVLR